MNLAHVEAEMGQVIAERLKPYVTGEKEPVIQHYFFVAYRGGVFMGARAGNPARIGELVPVINKAIRGFPDTRGFAQQSSLFAGGGGRNVEMNLQSRNLDRLLEAGRVGEQAILEIWPEARVQPLPGLELAEPELRMVPNERRIAEAGWDRATLARVVRALGDGLFVGEFFDGEETLDIIVRATPWATPEELGAIPLMTPNPGILPVSELTDVVRTAGPDQLRRIDRRRTITLQITPPGGVSLEEAIGVLRQQVEPVVRNELPADGDVMYTGAADKLEQALVNMSGSFVLAILILYLPMSALFRSFRDSLLVLLVLPLATVGSVAALQLLNLVTFQPMDLLTMIGFIILLGLVVNNAILLTRRVLQSAPVCRAARRSVRRCGCGCARS